MQSIAETCVRFDAAHLSINLVSEIAVPMFTTLKARRWLGNEATVVVYLLTGDLRFTQVNVEYPQLVCTRAAACDFSANLLIHTSGIIFLEEQMERGICIPASTCI